MKTSWGSYFNDYEVFPMALALCWSVKVLPQQKKVPLIFLK